MAKKKIDLSLKGLYGMLQNLLSLDKDFEDFKKDYESTKSTVSSHGQRLDGHDEFNSEVKKYIDELYEKIESGGGIGGTEEKVTRVDGEEVISVGGVLSLSGNPVIPGTFIVKNSEGIEIKDGFTVNYYLGKVTFDDKGTSGKFNVTYDYLKNGKINSRILRKSQKIQTIKMSVPSTSNSMFYAVNPVSSVEVGRKGDISYDAGNTSFKTTSLMDYSSDGLLIESDERSVVATRTIEGLGKATKFNYFSFMRNSPLAFIFPEDLSKLGSYGEYWVNSVDGSSVSVGSTGKPFNAKILILSDYSGDKLSGKTRLSSTGKTTITHNLKLDPKEYTVLFQPIGNTNGDLGDYWFDLGKDSFTVNHSGGSTNEFYYMIVEKSLEE